LGDINIPCSEQDALRSIDSEVLRVLVEQCLQDERPSALQKLWLNGCGTFVSTKLYAFERALDAYGKSKADKKRTETLRDARNAGSSLLYAVQQMQHRMAAEAEEGQRFYIDDLIRPPSAFRTPLSVRVNYRWRPSQVEPWVHGDITFLYDVEMWLDYTRSALARKPSAARQAQERQEALSREWNHLKDQALYCVRDYFREGGMGANIPKAFQVRPDPYTRGLNNFSAKFWPDQH
jgi:hypothetical protein